MDTSNRLENLRFIVRHGSKMEAERIQALVFLLDSLGESLGYFFEMHHFRVFSRTLAEDICQLGDDASSGVLEVSELVKSAIRHVCAAPLDDVVLAAAYVFFELRGYGADEIEGFLKPDSKFLSGAKILMVNLNNCDKKTLAVSAVA